MKDAQTAPALVASVIQVVWAIKQTYTFAMQICAARIIAWILRGIFGGLISIGIGCANHTPDRAAATARTSISTANTNTSLTTQPDMKPRPFLFDEASLPQGYPAPGPVGIVLLKNYPAARIAINRGQDQDGMFMPLFNHIKKHNIAMSSPVEITWSDPQTQPTQPQPQSMAFVYRQPDLGNPGIDGKVQVMDVPPQTFLSIGVRGTYNRQHLIAGVKSLKTWLTNHASEYQQSGPPRYLGYNSPFVPGFLRFGEVQIPVTPIKPPASSRDQE